MVVSQLVNHGVSSSLLEKLKHEIEEFFKLPLEEKMKYKKRPGVLMAMEKKVQSGDQKIDLAEKFYMIMNPIHTRKPYLFN